MTKDNSFPIVGHSNDAGSLRVFALQYRINLDATKSSLSWERELASYMDDFVVPHLDHRPALVVFPELMGMLSVLVGRPGDGARKLAQHMPAPSGTDFPVLMQALQSLGAQYGPQLAEVSALPGLDPSSALFVAAANTLGKYLHEQFSNLARTYGVYVVSGGFTPDLTWEDGTYRARDGHVYNSTYLWGPKDHTGVGAPWERNLLAHNKKVPLTEMEDQLLGITPGPVTGEEALVSAGPTNVAGFNVGFATSFPAFQYGYPYGEKPEDFDPLADIATRYVPTQNQLGVDVMIQADANAGLWAGYAQSGAWQPLEWMSSTWRAVTDPTVSFAYNVTPMMTGNLFDLPYDGQSSITGRGSQQAPTSYIGNLEMGPQDPRAYQVYCGEKQEFLALAPWVVPDGPRDQLHQVSLGLLAGTGSPFEGQYVKTALYADLVRN